MSEVENETKVKPALVNDKTKKVRDKKKAGLKWDEAKIQEQQDKQ